MEIVDCHIIEDTLDVALEPIGFVRSFSTKAPDHLQFIYRKEDHNDEPV